MNEIRTWPEQAGDLETYNEIRFANSRKGRLCLEGVKCTECESIYFPERFVCPKCHSRDLEKYLCARTGKIDTFWVDLRFAPVGYGTIEERIIAMVSLDDGLTIITEIVDCPHDKVKNGLRVEMVIRKLRRTDIKNVLYGYKFRPIKAMYTGKSYHFSQNQQTKKSKRGHPGNIPKSGKPKMGGHPGNIPKSGKPKMGGHPGNIPKKNE